MAITERDIERYRKDTVSDEFSVSDSAGAAQNITGYVFTLTIDEKENPPDSSTRILSLTGTILSAVGGTFEVLWDDTDADQEPAVYYYAVKSVDGDDKVATIAKGKYTFLPVVHQV